MKAIERYPVVLSVAFAALVIGGFMALKAAAALSIVLFLLAAAALTWRWVMGWQKGRGRRSQTG